MTGTTVRRRLDALVADGRLELPMPGHGRTADRWLALLALARRDDVAVARLAEAHVDALAILHEAGLEPVEHALYGVWASVGRGRDVELDADGRVSGSKPFCSGIGVVDRALVDVHVGDRRQLVDVAVGPGALDTVTPGDGWATPALADTATGPVRFAGHPVDRLVGDPGWYLDRVGFWHGASGPAACWAGAAIGLVDDHDPGDDPFRRAHFGAMRAESHLLETVLTRAGDAIDRHPDDGSTARVTALMTRYLVHESCLRIADRYARSAGPRGLIGERSSQRYADLLLYVRQFHADHDLVALTRTILDDG